MKNVSCHNIGATASSKSLYHPVFIAYHPRLYRFELSPIVFTRQFFNPICAKMLIFGLSKGRKPLYRAEIFFFAFLVPKDSIRTYDGISQLKDETVESV